MRLNTTMKEKMTEKPAEDLDYAWQDEEDVSPRPAADVPAERACISCGEPFMSEGWHNRLCPKCRRRSDVYG